LVPGIDQGAHVGGLVAGASIGGVLSPTRVVTIEDAFSNFGIPMVRTSFKKAPIKRILASSATGLLVALVISLWVTNSTTYDAATMGLYGYYELANN